MKATRLTPILLSLSIAAASSWAASIKGRIADNDGEPLPGTAVQIVSLPDTTRQGYQMADDEGNFSFSNLKPGKYVLIASMTGMDDIGKIS